MVTQSKVINCPLQKREVEVKYNIVGSWPNRHYEIESCPAMYDHGGCYRQCEKLLSMSPRSTPDYTWH